jgi:PAS domain S-box-containing protein
VTKDANFLRADVAAKVGLRGAIAFPILLGGETLAVMEFFSRAVREPDRQQLALLATVASQIAQCIERKRAEAARRESEQRWRAAFQNSPVGIGIAQLGGRLLEANPALRSMLGYTKEELRSLTFIDFTYEEDVELTNAKVAELLEGNRDNVQMQKRYVRKKGDLIWANTSVALIPATASMPRMVMAIIEDVTERKRNEEALRRSEAYLAEGERLTHTGSWARNSATGEMFWSQGMFRLFGYDPTQPNPPLETAIAERVHPEDRPSVEQAIERGLRAKKDFEHQHRIVLPDGSIRHHHFVAHPVIDASGDVVEIIGTTMDVTERKRAEEDKEKLEARLRQSQKMEAMGTLAGGIAHDFNNILGAILGYGEMAQKSAADGSATRRYLDNVMNAGNRAKRLVERILAFSRSGLAERVPVHVESVVAEAVDLLRGSLPPDIPLEVSLAVGNASVIGDATQIHQVVMNLCSNAIQAMAGGGTLGVTLDRLTLVAPKLFMNGRLAPGEYVRLAVSDTGSGIEPELLEHIFDPFFTTKGVGEGTGLGLSLVHGIVRDCGGGIEVHSHPGAGSTFEVYLPIAGEIGASAALAEAEMPHGQGETVMLVDDEPALVALGEEMLAELGYEPVGFLGSVTALQAFQTDPQRFDAVLTDETMPEMTGTELAQDIRKLRPDIPILLMSGYRGRMLAERARAAGVGEVLSKPLQSRDIAASLARALLSSR